MEIASKAIDEGNEVFFLVCEANLKTCFINPDHKKNLCNTCQSKVKAGIKALAIPAENILKLSQFEVGDITSQYVFSSVDDLKRFSYKNSDIGIAVASSLVSYTRDHQFDTNKYADKVNSGIATAIKVHEIGSQVIDLIKPDVVVMFNGRFLEYRPFMRLCENRNITFYTHERGGQIDRYMYRENATPHSLYSAKAEIESYWQLAGDEKYKIGENFYLDRRNRVVQSWSVFTEEQKVGMLPTGFDATKKNIGIFNSSMDEYEGILDFSNPIYNDDNEGIARICESFLEDESYHFYLRVHPNLKDLDNAQNKAINGMASKYKNLTIISAHDAIDSYALMEAVDTVVSFGSTMGIEAVFWGKASVLLGRAFYEDLDGIICPENHEQAVALIKDPPRKLSKESAVKFGYWVISFGIPFKYFKATDLFEGTFKGKKIRASIVTKIKNRMSLLSRDR